jgi:hypothetical protein
MAQQPLLQALIALQPLQAPRTQQPLLQALIAQQPLQAPRTQQPLLQALTAQQTQHEHEECKEKLLQSAAQHKCLVCGTRNPAYMSSTNPLVPADCPSVPVCGTKCEKVHYARHDIDSTSRHAQQLPHAINQQTQHDIDSTSRHYEASGRSDAAREKALLAARSCERRAGFTLFCEVMRPKIKTENADVDIARVDVSAATSRIDFAAASRHIDVSAVSLLHMMWKSAGEEIREVYCVKVGEERVEKWMMLGWCVWVVGVTDEWAGESGVVGTFCLFHRASFLFMCMHLSLCVRMRVFIVCVLCIVYCVTRHLVRKSCRPVLVSSAQMVCLAARRCKL